MNVANKDLCADLYELSGWDEAEKFWVPTIQPGPVEGEPIIRYELADSPVPGKPDGYGGHYWSRPAYGLSFLLRNLPAGIKGNYLNIVCAGRSRWLAMYGRSTTATKTGQFGEADTPEDALCMLAIELFKQGVLTKGVSDAN